MFIIFNNDHDVVETAVSHVEALNVVNYLTMHDTTHRPFHCTPVDGSVAA